MRDSNDFGSSRCLLGTLPARGSQAHVWPFTVSLRPSFYVCACFKMPLIKHLQANKLTGDPEIWWPWQEGLTAGTGVGGSGAQRGGKAGPRVPAVASALPPDALSKPG